jgi:hypothetical protein
MLMPHSAKPPLRPTSVQVNGSVSDERPARLCPLLAALYR